MTIRLTWKRVLAAIIALGVGGLLFAWSGLFQIAASSGHWRVTEWFLHWTMQNSARTYSAFQTPKAVRDDSGLVSAAGHFRQACQVCHGAPGQRPSPVMQSATPHAPNLAHTVGEYTDKELFWIVQHGVKYTGMPAWPARDRPDEVRRMVGFLRQLPAMTASEYADLSAPRPTPAAPAAIAGLVAQCASCHGADGLGRTQSDIPVLAGQKKAYLLSSLRSYAAGHRKSGPMQVAASALGPDEMRQLARFYASLPGLKDRPLPRGHRYIAEGNRTKQLPACASCHAPGKTAPLIGGQRAAYLAQRLRTWRGEETMIDAHKSQRPMPVIARRIKEGEIEPLAKSLANDRNGQ